MRPREIPFQGTGIDQNTGESVASAIERIIAERPDAAVEVQRVSEAVGLPGATVKRVFYILLSLRELKATFMPRHMSCGRVIGEQESSAETIQVKAENGDYGHLCALCGEPIEGSQDIETQIIFWRPGADVS